MNRKQQIERAGLALLLAAGLLQSACLPALAWQTTMTSAGGTVSASFQQELEITSAVLTLTEAEAEKPEAPEEDDTAAPETPEEDGSPAEPETPEEGDDTAEPETPEETGDSAEPETPEENDDSAEPETPEENDDSAEPEAAPSSNATPGAAGAEQPVQSQETRLNGETDNEAQTVTFAAIDPETVEQLTVTVTVKNAGSSPLELSGTAAFGDQSLPELEAVSLQPGEETQLTMELSGDALEQTQAEELTLQFAAGLPEIDEPPAAQFKKER